MLAAAKMMVVAIEVDVRPEITLPEYDGIELTVEAAEVTDEDVDAELERLRSRFGTLVTVDRPAKKGDFAQLDLVERTATAHGRSTKRMPSGAGHDAQMLARVCPAGMVFVPSRDGISHNPAEHTDDAQLLAGAEVLLDVVLALATTTGEPGDVE